MDECWARVQLFGQEQNFGRICSFLAHVDGVDYEVIAGFAVVRSKSSNPGKSSWGGDLRV